MEVCILYSKKLRVNTVWDKFVQLPGMFLPRNLERGLSPRDGRVGEAGCFLYLEAARAMTGAGRNADHIKFFER